MLLIGSGVSEGGGVLVVVLDGTGVLDGEGVTGVLDGSVGWGVRVGGSEGVEEGVYGVGACVDMEVAGLVEVSMGIRVALGRGGRYGRYNPCPTRKKVEEPMQFAC